MNSEAKAALCKLKKSKIVEMFEELYDAGAIAYAGAEGQEIEDSLPLFHDKGDIDFLVVRAVHAFKRVANEFGDKTDRLDELKDENEDQKWRLEDLTEQLEMLYEMHGLSKLDVDTETGRLFVDLEYRKHIFERGSNGKRKTADAPDRRRKARRRYVKRNAK